MIDRVGVPGLYRTIFVACNEKMLGFHADVKKVALALDVGQYAFQYGPRAIGLRLAIDEQVACKTGRVGHPGQRRIAVQIDTRQHVVRVGPLA